MIMDLGCSSAATEPERNDVIGKRDMSILFFSPWKTHIDMRVVHINGHVHIKHYWLVMFMTPLKLVLWCAANKVPTISYAFFPASLIVCIQSNYFKVCKSWIASIGIKIQDCVKIGKRTQCVQNFKVNFHMVAFFLHIIPMVGMKESKSLANQRT